MATNETSWKPQLRGRTREFVGKRQKLIGFAFLFLNVEILCPYLNAYVSAEHCVTIEHEPFHLSLRLLWHASLKRVDDISVAFCILGEEVYKTENTAVGIRHADHVASYIRK
jgi:hypothetical protein